MRIHKNLFVRSITLTVLALALSVAMTGPAASAGQSSECLGLIAALRTETEGVVIVGKNAAKNRTGLLGKLDGAARDLDRGKLCGAIGKLLDFNQKVSQLNASGSINADPTVGTTGLDLIADANAAIVCIQAQAAAGGITCLIE
jgi:hypothetical protein